MTIPYVALRGALLAAVLAGSLLAAKIHLDGRLDEEREVNTYIRREVAKLELESAEVRDFRDYVAQFLVRKKAVEALREEAVPAAEALAELTRLPATMVLTGVTIEGFRMSASGVADSDADLDKAVSVLGASAVLRKVRATQPPPPSGIREPARRGLPFVIEAELARPGR